jgi:misacylated tRNA(Ala) deacylase
MPPTKRLYWEDDHSYSADATVVAVTDEAVALDRTCFYPGGGGQPPDYGTLQIGTATVPINDVRADEAAVLWHCCPAGHAPQPDWVGQPAVARIDEVRRSALSRYHTVLHLVNTVALRDYGAWITGAQIDVAYARIDFKWEGFSPSLCADIEKKVNAEVVAARPIAAYSLSEQEFSSRPDLLRTLEKRPPIVDGRVRVVEIRGFDAQACGGTHVDTTAQIGQMSVERTENKGRINKRLYVRLA